MRSRRKDRLDGTLRPDTAEEEVRQRLIGYLRDEVGIPAPCMRCEWPVDRERSRDRADLVAFASRGTDMVPVLLAECKAPGIPLDGEVLAQVSRYVRRLPAPWVVLDNGTSRVVLHAGEDGWRAEASLPPWEVLREARPPRSPGS